MIERKLFNDIPGRKNDFHSAIFTTFSFDFQYFENQVLKALKRKWITSINILADQYMLDCAFEISIGRLNQISQSYAVTGMKSAGAFHPKISFFIGHEKVLILWGSGNITPGGHGKNHELFSGLYADTDHLMHLPLILETWEYLLIHSNQLEGYSRERIQTVAPANCSLLSKATTVLKHTFHVVDDIFKMALLYNEKNTIFQQLVNLLPINEIIKITIICPYFDEDGEAINNFLKSFPLAEMEVFIQVQDNFGLPPTEFHTHERVTFYLFDKTERGKKGLEKYEERKLHSKIFHFKTEKEEYCLVGSANATIPALGSFEKRAINDEFSALYQSSSYHFLEEIEIIGEKERITNFDFPKRNTLPFEMASSGNRGEKLRIKAIDLQGDKIKFYFECKLTDTSNLTLLCFDLDDVKRFDLAFSIPENVSIIEFPVKSFPKMPLYGVIVNEESKVISNKQWINNIYKLDSTHPGRENRNIQEIVNSLESGLIDEIRLIDFINELSDGRNKTSSSSGSSANADKDKKINEVYASFLTYGEASKIENTDVTRVIQTHSSTLLWQSLEKLFKRESDSLEDEQMDEEEEATREKSRKREYEESKKTVIDYRRFPSRSITKMVDNYWNHLNSKKEKINIIDYKEFLLISHILTTICFITDYSLSENISEKEWREDLIKIYQDSMLDILHEFACLHIKREIKTYEDTDLEDELNELIRKIIYYILICGTFILIKQIKNEKEVVNKVYISLLNILYKCGFPDERLNSFLEDYSKYAGNESLKGQVLKTTQKMEEYLCDGNDKYVFYKGHGMCLIKEKENGNYRLSSLLSSGLFSVPAKQFKGKDRKP